MTKYINPYVTHTYQKRVQHIYWQHGISVSTMTERGGRKERRSHRADKLGTRKEESGEHGAGVGEGGGGGGGGGVGGGVRGGGL